MHDYDESARRLHAALQDLSNEGRLVNQASAGGLVSAFVVICEVITPKGDDPAIVTFADENSRLSTSAGLLTLARATLIRNWNDQNDADDDDEDDD